MEGHIRKRGDKWYYSFEAASIGGKRKRIERVGGRTKKEAEAALRKALDEYERTGTHYDPSDISVSDYLDYWFDNYVKVNLKYSTQAGYLMLINNHLRPRFGQYKLLSITPAMLQEYANSLKPAGLSKSHIDGILSTFSVALDYAVEPLRYIPDNPMRLVRFPKVEKKPRERIILALEDWEKIISRFSGTRFYIPLLIGFYTGLRISETCALTWDDIDLTNRTLSVNKQVVKRNFGADVRKAVEKKGKKGKKEQRSSWYFTTPKTVSSNRLVKFGETLYHALKEEKELQEKNEEEYGEFYTVHVLKKEMDEKGNDMYRIVPVQKCVGSELQRVKMVCVSENGEYTSTDSFKYCSRTIHFELKLAFDYHSLRHTHATLLIESGANPKNVQARLGHSNVTTTMQTYVHDTEKMTEDSVALFEKAVLPTEQK
jgi:integrase